MYASDTRRLRALHAKPLTALHLGPRPDKRIDTLHLDRLSVWTTDRRKVHERPDFTLASTSSSQSCAWLHATAHTCIMSLSAQTCGGEVNHKRRRNHTIFPPKKLKSNNTTYSFYCRVCLLFSPLIVTIDLRKS